MNIYFVGIAGVGMGNLAVLMQKLGHRVSGSDAKVFPPMSVFLENEKISYTVGFNADNIPQDTDLVVVGNAIRKDNIEVVAAEKREINRLSMPQAINKFLLEGKQSIVVSGTHGKTTTTSIAAHTFVELGTEPGYFIGGIANNLGTGGAIGKGEYFIIEGDEYDSAFFQKEPKFLSYAPKYLILTAVEFDHGDIYKDLDAVKKEFRRLVNLVPSDGIIVASSAYEHVLDVIKNAKAKVVTVGESEDDNYFVSSWQQTPKQCETKFSLKNNQNTTDFSIGLAGQHNVWNAAQVAALASELGFETTDIQSALASFKGVKRRQQILFESEDVVFIEDFAHHPTAVELTVDSIRRWYPDRKVWIIFEPRSNTSRRNYHQDTFPKAFAGADRAFLYKVFRAEDLPTNELLDREKLQRDVEKQGGSLALPNSVDELMRAIQNDVSKKVIVMMTNGNLDGFKPNFLEWLKSRPL